MSTTRYFVVAPERAFIPPKGLMTGPGAKSRRFAAGELVELDAAKVDRFIRNRVRAGDIVEIDEATATTLKAELAAAARAAVASAPPVVAAPAAPPPASSAPPPATSKPAAPAARTEV